MSKIKTKNIIFLGDPNVGKTTLIQTYFDKDFNPSYNPTIFDKKGVQVMRGGTKYLIKFHDTSGRDEYEHVRNLVYETADAFTFCYGLDSRDSFNNVLYKWQPKVKHLRRVPITLIATKSDTREDNRCKISEREGERLAKVLHAEAFNECTAKMKRTSKEAMHNVIEAVIAADRNGYDFF